MRFTLIVLVCVLANIKFCLSQKSNSNQISSSDIHLIRNYVNTKNKFYLVNMATHYQYIIKPAGRATEYLFNVSLNTTVNSLTKDSILSFACVSRGERHDVFNGSSYWVSDSVQHSVLRYSVDSVNFFSARDLLKTNMPSYIFKPFIYASLTVMDQHAGFEASLLDDTVLGSSCWKVVFCKKQSSKLKENSDSISYFIQKSDYTLLKKENYRYNSKAKDFTKEIYQFSSPTPSQFTRVSSVIDSLQTAGYTVKDYIKEDATTFFEKADTFTFAPDFVLRTITGDTLSLSGLNAKYVAFDFSYFSCPPCIFSVKPLNKIYATYKNKGFSLFWVDAVDATDMKFAAEQIKKHGIQFPVYFDREKTVTNQYGIEAFPNFFLIEMPSRKIVKRFKGFDILQEKELKEFLEKSLP